MVPPALAALRPVAWSALDGWREEDPRPALEAFLHGCTSLEKQAVWAASCAAARGLERSEAARLRAFFEQDFVPHLLINADGSEQGLVTGYYEPLLKGSRTRSKRTPYPVYGVPDDLLVIDIAGLHPELKHLRLRGRLEGRRVIPYYSRADIEDGKAKTAGKALFWVENAVELFFLQIQGSGQVELPGGERVRIGYADQNGHPYQSIGRLLVERGELTLDRASMQGIMDWAARNPDKLPGLLNANPSFVFFRELPRGLSGPLGALGVPLTAGHSIAVDPRSVPLGAPVFLATTWPNSSRPLRRLTMAQDTGGAIKGGVRADFFWGFGPEAGKQAGGMKQAGRMWVLLPKGWAPPAP